MAHIEFSPTFTDDIDRIIDHLLQHDAIGIDARIREILSAIDVLGENPRIGRLVDGCRRELVIGRETRGYLALYRYTAAVDTVHVIAIRSQREVGYFHEA